MYIHNTAQSGNLAKTDNSSKEFALAPDGKDRFIISGFGDNKKYFYAGEHTPADFPYIIPGIR